MNIKILYIFLAFLFITCKTKQDLPKSYTCSPLEQVTVTEVNEMETDLYTLQEATQVENCLRLQVKVQGKKLAYSRLLWSGAVARSYPPQMTARLITKIDGNKSKKWVTHTLYFSLDVLVPQGKMHIYLLDDERSVLFEPQK